MPQALNPAAYIFEGVWVNHAHSSINGWTLTLAPARATLLTNALALFVALAGGQLWTIVRFLLHQWKALPPTKKHRILHHKEQIILRNATSGMTTTQLMWSHAWTSRRHGKTYSRAIWIGLLAMLHAALFMTGAAFSNQLVGASSAVLSRSPYCGLFNSTYYQITYLVGLNPSSEENMTLSWQEYNKRRVDVESSLQYTIDCYLSESSANQVLGSGVNTGLMSTECNTLAQPSLNWSTSQQSACPFGSGCHKESPVMVLDTGDLDSHQHLGINAPSKDRVTYRRVTTCVPLNDTGHLSGWTGFVESPSTQPEHYVAYEYYGPNNVFSTDYTYAYSDFAAFYTNFSAGATSPYQLYASFAYTPGGPRYGDFTPVSELEQDDADLMLAFLSYTGSYLTPVDDPWFSAHRQHEVNSTSYPYINNQYARDFPVSTLACTEQHRFCNPALGICTPLTGSNNVQDLDPFNLNLTQHQVATSNRILAAMTFSGMAEVLTFLGDRSLLASSSSQSSSTSLSLHLPDNQWQLEVQYWHSVAMAHLQKSIADGGTGQIAADTTYLEAPVLERDIWLCQNYMIRSTTYQSFHLLDIIIIFVIGLIVIILSFTIEDIAGWKRLQRTSPVRMQYWAQDDMLNLPLFLTEDAVNPNLPAKDGPYRSASSKSTKAGRQLSENGSVSDTSTSLPAVGSHDDLTSATVLSVAFIYLGGL